MASRRFILRYRLPGAKPQADVERVRDVRGVTIIDESAPRMLLIECDEDAPAALAEALPDWIVVPEQTLAVPDTRRRVR